MKLLILPCIYVLILLFLIVYLKSQKEQIYVKAKQISRYFWMVTICYTTLECSTIIISIINNLS